MTDAARWFVTPKPAPRARARLFCFPYAGGSSLFYQSWPASIPADHEVVAVEPPGRRNRMMEKPFPELGPLLDSLEAAILTRLDKPFSFFGHSTGALVAYELARRLRRRGAAGPARLLVAGAGAPHMPLRREPYAGLTDDEFIERIRRFGGTSEAVLQQRELMELMLPLFRADFSLMETYKHEPEPPLSIPIHVYGGISDPLTPRPDLDAWSEHTTGRALVHMFEGDHFFVTAAHARLMPLVVRALMS